MAAPSLTYSLANGNTADATQVMQNYNDLLNGITDGTKDLSVNALTVATRSYIHLSTQNGNGSSNTTVRRFSNTITSTGSDITYADSSTLGATFTINTAGLYSISYSDADIAGGNFGLTLNSTQLTTNVAGVTTANVLFIMTAPGGEQVVGNSITRYFVANDVLRAQTDGAANTTSTARVHFHIQRIL